MSAARSSAARPRGLVLVRGGLDAHGGGGGDDWEDFCRRIGWQTGAPAPDAGFEERIAEGIFTAPVAPENVVDLDLARETRRAGSGDLDPSFAQEIRRSFVREIQTPLEVEAPLSEVRAREADVAPDAEPDGARKVRARAGVAVFALALAAAVLLVVARLALSSAPAPAASIAAPSAEVSHAVTARAPVDAPPEVAPVRETPPEGPRKTAPSPSRRKGPSHAKPVPPGALIARHSPEAPARQRSHFGDRSVELASFDANGAEPRLPWAGAGTKTAPGPAGSLILPRIALPAAEGIAPAKRIAGAEVWSSDVPATGSAASRGLAKNASWTLSGAKDRWVGASVTPAPPSFAQANIGVMVQLDLGKALSRL